ncbi:Brp/Blh family beta-carotene 15,15'-dioxygenase [Pelagibacteraceae bacterium]|nr:Brp/Blh family beta-carotene 15,15'-dioxygenase [Pelagibacteraceae bacterium]
MNYKTLNKIARLNSKHSCIFFLLVIFSIFLSKFFLVLDASFLIIICFFLIATVGVSHGSLDNYKGEKLLRKHKIKNKILFYFSYVFLACIVIILWRFLPSFSLLLFLIVASYHFGKEDTEPFLFTAPDEIRRPFFKWNKKNYYFFTFLKGFLIISAPLFFHYEETKNIFKILDSNFSLHDQVIITLFFLSIYSYIHFNFVLNARTYGSGAVMLDGSSILLLNYFFSPLIAFTLYFCFLHSVRHSISLIATLDKKNLKKGTLKFLKKALPLTLATAILFITSVYILSNYYVLNDAILKVIFIGLASLTFPHILLEYLLEKNEKRS